MEECPTFACTIFEKDYAILVENLNVSYGKTSILENVSMQVEEATVYGLLGSSGCGKTTLLHCILNLKPWKSGEVFVFGKRIAKTKQIETRNIGYMPQDLALYDQLTVSEIMRYFSQLYGMTKAELESIMLFLEDLMDLPGYSSRRICTLSGGQQRRISLSLTLIHQPRLLILDEPTVGLDPLLRESLWNYLYNLTKTSKTTIVITTHYIEEVKRANKVGIMRKGRLLVEEDPAVLMREQKTDILEDVVRNICFNHAYNYKPEKIETKNSQVDRKCITSTAKLLRICQSTTYSRQSISDSKQQEGMHLHNLFLSLIRSLAYSKVVLINFVRHPIFVFLVLFLPPFQLITTGCVLGVEPKFTQIGIVDYEVLDWQKECSQFRENANVILKDDCDLSHLSCSYLNLLRKDDILQLIEYKNVDDAHKAVEQGYIKGYIVIPNNFTTRIIERAATMRFASEDTLNGTTIKLHFDMTDFIEIVLAGNHIFNEFLQFVRDMTDVCHFDLRLVDVPFDYRTPVYGKMDETGQEYTLPALIIAILFEISYCVVPLAFIREIKSGTLIRSKMAGLRFPELMTGLFLSAIVMSLVQSIVCFITMKYILNLEVHGNPLLYISLCVVAAVCGGMLGLLFGTICRDEFVVIVSVTIFVVAFVINAGVLRPDEVTPLPYRSYLYYCYPGAAIVTSLRWVVNRGVGLLHFQVWSGVIITLGWIVVYSLCTLITFSFSDLY